MCEDAHVVIVVILKLTKYGHFNSRKQNLLFSNLIPFSWYEKRFAEVIYTHCVSLANEFTQNTFKSTRPFSTFKYKVRYEKKTDLLIYLNVIHIVLSTRDLRKTKTNNKHNLNMASSLGSEQERNSPQESFFQNCSTHALQTAIFGSPQKTRHASRSGWTVMKTWSCWHVNHRTSSLLDQVMAWGSLGIPIRSVDEILFRYQSNETTSAVHSHSTQGCP